MSTASIFYDYIENVQPVCVTPQEFYRTIFAEGELQKTGVMNDGKFNAMIQISKDKFIYLHDELDNIPDYEKVVKANMNFLAYAGMSGEDKLARELHALAIRVNFPVNMVWQHLQDLFERHKLKGLPRMRPTFVMKVAETVIFVYVLDKPIPMFKKFQKKLTALHNTLSREIHDAFGYCRKPRQGGVFVRYPVVGTVADKDICEAYRTGDLYTLDDINALVPKAQQLDYHQAKVTVEEAKELWPEWTHQRVELKKPLKTEPHMLNRKAYTVWFCDIIRDRAYDIQPGALRALASYGIKSGIELYQIQEDVSKLADFLKTRFPEKEVEMHRSKALSLARNEPKVLHSWSVAYMQKLCGITFPKKEDTRKYESQAAYMKDLHKKQSKEQDVLTWRAEHPGARPVDCVNATGMSWHTVCRWWDGTGDSAPKPKSKKKSKKASKAKQESTRTYKMFDCGCGNPNVKRTTQKWFWDERGNHYKRTVYTCENCGCVKFGKARVDNSCQ